MPAEMSTELEHLLIDLVVAEESVARARELVLKRQQEIAAPLVDKAKGTQQADRAGTLKALGQEMADLRRGKYRSELAHLAAEVVSAERRRAQILHRLADYPQFGEPAPAVDIGVEHDGERGFTIKTGGGRNFSFKLPVPIYRELWRGDGQYSRADMVTHDGSLWIAVADAPAHEPGKGAAWRLAAMRGKNGKDVSRNLRSSN